MSDTLNRLAFAIQEEGMTRLQARRLAKAVLEALQPGDYVGQRSVVRLKSRYADKSDLPSGCEDATS